MHLRQQPIEGVDLDVDPFGLRQHVSERVVDLVRDAGRQRPQRHHPIIADRRLLQPVELADVVREPRQTDDLARRPAQRRQPGVVDRLADRDRVPERISRQGATDVAGNGGVGAVDIQHLLSDELARLHAEGRQARPFGHRDHAVDVGRPDGDGRVVAGEAEVSLHPIPFDLRRDLRGDVQEGHDDVGDCAVVTVDRRAEAPKVDVALRSSGHQVVDHHRPTRGEHPRKREVLEGIGAAVATEDAVGLGDVADPAGRDGGAPRIRSNARFA